MTKHQLKVCKYVVRYKKLNRVLSKSKISDYLEIQEILGPGNSDFSDGNMDDSTEITLSNNLVEDMEEHYRQVMGDWWTRGLAIAAIIISAVALLSQLGILGLPRY